MNRHWPFWILLGIQSLGAGVIYWLVVPRYREVLIDAGSYQAELSLFGASRRSS